MPKVKKQSQQPSIVGIGGVKYITQPSTNVAQVKGDVVIAPYFTYKRRFA